MRQTREKEEEEKEEEGTTLNTFSGAILTYSTHQCSRAHAHFAMLTAFVCWIGFGFDVTRYVNWQVASNGSVVVGILLDAMLLPIWLVGLAYQLRQVARQGGGYEAEDADWWGQLGTHSGSDGHDDGIDHGPLHRLGWRRPRGRRRLV